MVPHFGVICPDRVGVICSSLASAVLMGVRAGFAAFAGSGKTMSSIASSTSTSASDACSLRLDLACRLVAPFLACCLILINDAGVAGSSGIEAVGTGFVVGCFASKEGDWPAVLDLGVAGGGINISESDSGEIDSASELSWVYGSGGLTELMAPLALPALFFDACSMILETSRRGIVVLEVCFFLLCGFIAGDCLIDLAGFFCVGRVFRRVFLAGTDPELGRLVLKSMGEVVSEVSELRVVS